MELEQLLSAIENHPYGFTALVMAIFVVCIPIFCVRVKWEK